MGVAVALSMAMVMSSTPQRGNNDGAVNGLYVWGVNRRGTIPNCRIAEVGVPHHVDFFDNTVWCIMYQKYPAQTFYWGSMSSKISSLV